MVPLSSDVTVRTIGAATKASPSARVTCTTDLASDTRIMALGHQGQARQPRGIVLGPDHTRKQ